MTLQEMFDLLRPVGSFYETSNVDFDPSMAGWFGTWVEETDSRALIAKSGANSLNETGGENTHTLTAAETPAHTHTGTMVVVTASQGNTGATAGNTKITSHWNTIQNGDTYISSFYGMGNYNTTGFGSGGEHENRQPYILVRRFRRTA